MKNKLYKLKANHPLYGKKGRLMREEYYRDLPEEHKVLFTKKEELSSVKFAVSLDETGEKYYRTRPIAANVEIIETKELDF